MELEELLVQEGVAAAREQIRAVLDDAARDGRHPAAALIEGGIVGEDVLADLLARAAGTVVVDLDDRAQLDGDAAHLVSGDVARELLLLPLEVAGGKLRVVFVNPLDQAALDAVAEASAMPIQPVVGTLTELRAAIEKAYAGRTTRVVRVPSSEMPHEITQKFAAQGDAPPIDTSPLHRIEHDATIEQRHEALLLALIERGIVTRAEYLEALKRLLSGRK